VSEIKNNIPIFKSPKLIAKYEHSNLVNDYLKEILEYNERVNLVSRETNFAALERLAADSLVPFEFLGPPKGKIFDIGPGAGFPSLVILLAFPEIEGVLFERTHKKAIFLKSIVKKFSLSAGVADSNFVEASKAFPSNSFNFGFMKYVKLHTRILACALTLLNKDGKFIYYSQTTGDISHMASINCATRHYYLDDPENLRTISIFSHKE